MTGTRARRAAPAPALRGNGACRSAPRHAPTQGAQGEHERLLPVRSALDLHGDGAAAAALLVAHRDPASMTPEERQAQLGQILAAGYRRMRLNRGQGLAGSPESEAPCDQAVDGDGAEPAEEVA